MFKLVKNEMYKIFHKKSTYITLFVLLLFIVLTNVIYKNMNIDSSYSTYYNDSAYLNDLKSNIDNFNMNTGDMYEYANLKATYDIESYTREKEDNWKTDSFYSSVADDIRNYYIAVYVEKNTEEATRLKALIDDKKAKLENNDWRYFVNEKLGNVSKDITNVKENPTSVGDANTELKKLEYQKYLLEYRLDNDVSYESSYLNTALNAQEYLIEGKLSYENAKTDDEKNSYKDSYSEFYENEYILKNKVDVKSEDTLRGVLVSFFSEYGFLILVFVIMVSGAIVSDEFSKGTIKSLLTLPYKRNQILVAKLITVLLMIPFVTLFMLASELIIGGITFGFSSLSVPVIAYNFSIGAVEVMGLAKHFVLSFLGILPMYLLLGTLAFALSTLLCNTAFAITVTFCGYIASSLINEFAYYYKIKFLNYFVTTNWDLRDFMFGGTSRFSIPMAESIIICLIYFAIMVIISLVVFKKKNIKNI